MIAEGVRSEMTPVETRRGGKGLPPSIDRCALGFEEDLRKRLTEAALILFIFS